MNRMELLVHEMEITFDKEDWYPPLGVVLKGVTAAQASWRPEGEAANTIWENVNHLLFYKERLLKQLSDQPFERETADNDSTFTVTAAPDDEEAWQATVQKLEAVHKETEQLLRALPEEGFDRHCPNRPIGMMVTSILLHDVFHTGQIVLLRKLQGSWPARRSFD